MTATHEAARPWVRGGEVDLLPARRRRSTVNLMLATDRRSAGRAKQARPPVENDAYEAMVARCLRAFGRRVAGGNLEDIARLLRTRALLDATLDASVAELHAAGESWARIGAAVGMSRQAAQQRWG